MREENNSIRSQPGRGGRNPGCADQETAVKFDMASSSGICSLKSFLAHELSEFADIFANPKFNSSLIAEFAILQAIYREEGELVFPNFFITDDLAQLIKVTGSQERIPIGFAEYSELSVQRVFKECAILAANEPWSIYVSIGSDAFEFGVFRVDRDPLKPTAFEKLRLSRDHSFNVCGLNRIGQNFVEIRSNQDHFRYVNTGSDQDRTMIPDETIYRFSALVTQDVGGTLQRAVETFYSRLIFDILHASTGALLVVVRAGREWPELLSDGIRLTAPIDVASEIQKLIANPNANDIHRSIESKSKLIQSMSHMDGLVVIDTKGSVLGYRFFIKQLDLSSVTGGARRRAFAGVSANIGEDIVAGLYKSSDGAIRMVDETTALRELHKG